MLVLKPHVPVLVAGHLVGEAAETSTGHRQDCDLEDYTAEEQVM